MMRRFLPALFLLSLVGCRHDIAKADAVAIADSMVDASVPDASPDRAMPDLTADSQPVDAPPDKTVPITPLTVWVGSGQAKDIVSCQKGLAVAGGAICPAYAYISTSHSVPDPNTGGMPTGWSARCGYYAGSKYKVPASVWVVCVEDQRLAKVLTAEKKLLFRKASVTCPGGSRFALGGGCRSRLGGAYYPINASHTDPKGDWNCACEAYDCAASITCAPTAAPIAVKQQQASSKTTTATVTCPSGTVRLGGGCSSTNGYVLIDESYPLPNGWHCKLRSPPATAYVLCAATTGH